MSQIELQLAEWSTLSPDNTPALRDLDISADMLAAIGQLRHRLRFTELRRGVSIASNAHVGRVRVGPLDVHIRPKLDALQLIRLMRYTYGLQDLHISADTSAPVSQLGLHDLLASLLAADVANLLHHGLIRRYVSKKADVHSVRGRIDVAALAARGGLWKAALPCVVEERDHDWHLHQVMLAGLQLATSLTNDFLLRRKLHHLMRAFDGIAERRLSLGDIDTALRSVNRQTEAYQSALQLIRLLAEGCDISPDEGEVCTRSPGYLFNMNTFFQRLLSRFLQDHLHGWQIRNEESISRMFAYAPDANPKRHRMRSPRPDYALYEGLSLRCFMDAKYRDLWQSQLSTEWLYQLSLYATAAPSRQSILLYATTCSTALDQRIELQKLELGSAEPASVIIRPVVLPEMTGLLDNGDKRECRNFAAKLVNMATN